MYVTDLVITTVRWEKNVGNKPYTKMRFMWIKDEKKKTKTKIKGAHRGIRTRNWKEMPGLAIWNCSGDTFTKLPLICLANLRCLHISAKYHRKFHGWRFFTFQELKTIFNVQSFYLWSISDHTYTPQQVAHSKYYVNEFSMCTGCY